MGGCQGGEGVSYTAQLYNDEGSFSVEVRTLEPTIRIPLRSSQIQPENSFPSLEVDEYRLYAVVKNVGIYIREDLI